MRATTFRIPALHTEDEAAVLTEEAMYPVGIAITHIVDRIGDYPVLTMLDIVGVGIDVVQKI
jgi:hypothetical protein